MCKCEKKGLQHWWQYLRLRLRWREFKRWCSMHVCPRVTINGKEYYVLDWGYKPGAGYFPRLVSKGYFPGPSMSLDEYKHWFPKKEQVK